MNVWNRVYTDPIKTNGRIINLIDISANHLVNMNIEMKLIDNKTIYAPSDNRDKNNDSMIYMNPNLVSTPTPKRNRYTNGGVMNRILIKQSNQKESGKKLNIVLRKETYT